MKALDRDRAFAFDADVVIGDDEENGVLPVVTFARFFDELPESIVRVFDRVVVSALFLVVQGNAPVREFKRGVVG